MTAAAFVSGLFALEGRVALVTGASSGIGRRLATTLARAGARVVGAARRRDQLEETVGAIESQGGEAALVEADLATADLEDVARRSAAPFGDPDIVVNAAGVNLRQPVEAISREDWELTLWLNLGAPFFLTRHLVPGMRGKQRGAVVNIASLQSFRAFADSVPYGASKGGVVQLTRAMAEAWSPEGITVNAIAPGMFPTSLTEAVFADSERAARFAGATAIGRNGELSDLDGAIVFLASPAASYITGQTLMVDGGYTAK